MVVRSLTVVFQERRQGVISDDEWLQHWAELEAPCSSLVEPSWLKWVDGPVENWAAVRALRPSQTPPPKTPPPIDVEMDSPAHSPDPSHSFAVVHDSSSPVISLPPTPPATLAVVPAASSVQAGPSHPAEPSALALLHRNFAAHPVSRAPLPADKRIDFFPALIPTPAVLQALWATRTGSPARPAPLRRPRFEAPDGPQPFPEIVRAVPLSGFSIVTTQLRDAFIAHLQATGQPASHIDSADLEAWVSRERRRLHGPYFLGTGKYVPGSIEGETDESEDEWPEGLQCLRFLPGLQPPVGSNRQPSKVFTEAAVSLSSPSSFSVVADRVLS